MVVLIFDALAAMAGSSGALQRLTLYDVEVAKGSGATVTPSLQDDCAKGVRRRVTLLRQRLVWPLLLLGSAAISALIADNYLAVWRFEGGTLGVLSVFAFAWAGLARLGWEGQSVDGKTSVEKVDGAIFMALCWIGMYFAVLAVAP